MIVAEVLCVPRFSDAIFAAAVISYFLAPGHSELYDRLFAPSRENSEMRFIV